MSDLVDDMRKRKAKKKRGNASSFGGDFDMSMLTTVRHKFTKEENFEAYKLFCIMDVDRSGLVSLRELQRVLCGDTFRTLDVSFDHPDVGITWTLDSDNCVCIQRIEPLSPASKVHILICGLRLYQINDLQMKMFHKRSLEKLQHELIRIHDDPIDLKFVEPLFIITKMTCSLDVQVYGKTYTAWLPIGAVNSVTVMEENIKEALAAAHRDFKHIDVRINRKTLSVSFYCPEFAFCLQFGTGANFQSSCRYAIGFSALDTGVSKRQTGHDTAINLNLGLSGTEMDILMGELFGIFDVDGSGEFQFEEFRDFHTKLLANDDCVEILQSYARFRFADIKTKAREQGMYEERRAKMKRRYLLKEKNKEIHEQQLANRKAHSMVGEDGVCRRVYEARKHDAIRVTSPHKLSGKAVGSSKTAAKEESAAHKDREKMKERRRLQDLAKQRKLNELIELNRDRERDVKRLERDLTQKSSKIHMAEVLHVLRKVYSKGLTRADTDVEGMGAMGIMQDKIITPALKVSSNLFTDNACVDDIDLEELPPTEIHPASGKYFFMRERVDEKYNVHCRHPTFFGADFSREASRHSSFALGVCRAALSQRQVPMAKVTVIKHPMALARIAEIDREVVANELSKIISVLDPIGEVAERHVGKLSMSRGAEVGSLGSSEVLSSGHSAITDEGHEQSSSILDNTVHEEESNKEESAVLGASNDDEGLLCNESLSAPSSSLSLQEHESNVENQCGSVDETSQGPGSVLANDFDVGTNDIKDTPSDSSGKGDGREREDNADNTNILFINNEDEIDSLPSDDISDDADNDILFINIENEKNESNEVTSAADKCASDVDEDNEKFHIDNLSVENDEDANEIVFINSVDRNSGLQGNGERENGGDSEYETEFRNTSVKSRKRSESGDSFSFKSSAPSSDGDSNSDSGNDNDSETCTTNDQTADSFVPAPRTDTARKQRANVYNGLSKTLSTQLSGLSMQIQKLSKEKEMQMYAALSGDSRVARRAAFSKSVARNALLEGSLSYLRLRGVIVPKYALELKFNEHIFGVDTSSLDTSIHHNTATVLVQALCNFAVGRVAEATKNMSNFWAFGTNVLNNEEASEDSSAAARVKARPRRQGTIQDLLQIAAVPATPDMGRHKRREGMVLKRMSTSMSAANHQHKFGGKHDDLDDASSANSEVPDPRDESELPKNLLMGVHAMSSFEVLSDDPAVLKQLRSVQPRLRAKVTFGQWKVYSYECDSLRDKSSTPQPDVGNSLSKFSWSNMDVEDRLLWNDVQLRSHQAVHLSFTDGSSRVDNVVCHGELAFDHIRSCHERVVRAYEEERRLKRAIIDNNVMWESNIEHKPFDVPVTLKCSSSIAEGVEVEVKGVVRMSVLMNGANWIFPPRDEKYWRSKRSQHWTTYPLVPTATGIVRQKFRDIANDYDKMKLVHPAFWGFSVRWKGPERDEVRFMHPMFHNFSLVKKPISQVALEEIDLNARKKIKVNPYKWKPIQECKVCYANVPGCPRCWDMPLRKSGERYRPVDFQFDPDAAIKKHNEATIKEAMLEQKKQARIAARRALRDAGELDYDSDDTLEDSMDTNPMITDPDDEEVKVELHTQLTTLYALELYRKRAQNLMTVFVKIAPGGYVRRLVADGEDSIWHLHNMLRSHADCGSVRGAQFVMPTVHAFYECDADIIPESEFLGARVTANIKLKDYGLRAGNSEFTILYLPKYKESTIIPLMQRFMEDNLDTSSMQMNLPILSYIHDIPLALEKDGFQVKLCAIVKRQFQDQEMLQMLRIKALGAAHQNETHQQYTQLVAKKQEDKLQEARERKDFEKKAEKVLRGLQGAEREARRLQLLEEHFARGGGTQEERDKAAKAKKDADRADKLRKKREMIAQGLLTTSASTSKVHHMIGDSILSQGSAASTASRREVEEGDDERFKNNMMTSFVEESSSQSQDDQTVGSPRRSEPRVLVPPLLLHSHSQSHHDSGTVHSGSAMTFEENDLSVTSKSFPKLKKGKSKGR